jgi:hypothetical protein
VRVDWEGHSNNCYRVGGGSGENKFDLVYAEDPPAPLKAKLLGTDIASATSSTTAAAAATLSPKPKPKPPTVVVKLAKGKKANAAVAKGPHFAVGDQKVNYPGYHAVTMDEYVHADVSANVSVVVRLCRVGNLARVKASINQ